MGGKKPEWAEHEYFDQDSQLSVYGLAKDTAPTGNYIDRTRHQTYVKITKFQELPRFWINSPTFNFDSHGDTTDWSLFINQRHYDNTVRNTVVQLFHGHKCNGESVKIRLTGVSGKTLIRTFDDVVAMFEGDFDIVHAHELVMVTKQKTQASLNQFSDQELLAEVHRRTMASLGDYRGPKKIREDVLSNIIDFESISRRVEFDQNRVLEILDGD
jgi:hypothetical protein